MKLPPRLQKAVNEACAQTGLMYMSLEDMLQVFDDEDEDEEEIEFIMRHPGNTQVFPEA
jgi:hypothetical protein